MFLSSMPLWIVQFFVWKVLCSVYNNAFRILIHFLSFLVQKKVCHRIIWNPLGTSFLYIVLRDYAENQNLPNVLILKAIVSFCPWILGINNMILFDFSGGLEYNIVHIQILSNCYLVFWCKWSLFLSVTILRLFAGLHIILFYLWIEIDMMKHFTSTKNMQKWIYQIIYNVE